MSLPIIPTIECSYHKGSPLLFEGIPLINYRSIGFNKVFHYSTNLDNLHTRPYFFTYSLASSPLSVP